MKEDKFYIMDTFVILRSDEQLYWFFSADSLTLITTRDNLF